MCELFAISAESPIQFQYSLEEFAKHGGLIKPHKSGWGIAAYQNKDLILLKEAEPAAYSPLIKFIADSPIRTHLTIAHVRYATHGKPNFENTHPFSRELGGRQHVFAHNGELDNIFTKLPLSSSRFLPMGETDSEHAFCYLLNQLSATWDKGTPSAEQRLKIVSRVAEEFVKLGAANFLYSDGEILFAHSHQRRFSTYNKGEAVFSEVREPGLCIAKRNEVLTNGLKITPLNPCDALMIASVPLTESGWTPLPTAKVIAIKNGQYLNIN
ncbi:MAG: glutamine amidotransferase [Pseudohongiellaceae bacterium]|jgi:glutamine amidotransferase